MNGQLPAIRGSLISTAYVVRLTWLDFVRRKDLYVVAIFMLLFVIATIVVRIIGIGRASTARFLMSAGLTLAHFLAAFLAASFSARCFPEEFERGTLMPLLAKSVSRSEVLAGKMLACLGLALGSYVLFVLATLVAVPLVAGQQMTALAQVAVLQMTGLALLGLLAAAISLYLPTLVSALIAMLWYFCSGFALNMIGQLIRARNAVLGGWGERLLACLPDAAVLCHTECFAGSNTHLPAPLFAGLMLYGLAWVVALYVWASWRFQRIRL